MVRYGGRRFTYLTNQLQLCKGRKFFNIFEWKILFVLGGGILFKWNDKGEVGGWIWTREFVWGLWIALLVKRRSVHTKLTQFSRIFFYAVPDYEVFGAVSHFHQCCQVEP